MKILKLRLMNLNSLAGEWSFDFSHPAIETGGLLVITGPTGSGKTTILDAVCLALYGQTPRLGRLSEAENEIMTRGRAECSAEITFEAPAGRYRCHWSQRRARKRLDGKLQAPRHEIVDDLSGRVLESSLSKTLAEVEKVTGMSFDQFSRSVMLAQGAFAAFLEAPPRDRAGLLERITGADIYSRISALAFERRAQEQRRLEDLERELEAVAVPEEDPAALTAEAASLAASVAEWERESAAQQAALAWRRDLAALEAAGVKLAAERDELERRAHEFQPDQARLELALKALALAGERGGLEELRQRRARTGIDLERRRRERPTAEAAAAEAARTVLTAEGRLAEARTAEEAARPELIEARALDVELRELERRLAPAAQKLAVLLDDLRELSKGRWPAGPQDLDRPDGWPSEITAALTRLEGERTRAAGRLTELLAGRDLAARRDELLALGRRQDRLEKLAEDLFRLDGLRKVLEELNLSVAKMRAELTAVGEELARENELAALLEKKSEELTGLWKLEQRIKSFEEHRAELAEGRPCPLCGSLEHPFAAPGGLPADQGRAAELEDNRARLAAVRKKITTLIAAESARKRDLANAGTSENKQRSEAAALDRLTRDALVALAVAAAPDEALPAVRSLSRESRKEFEAAGATLKEAETLEREGVELEARIQAGLKIQQRAGTLIEAALGRRAETDELARREAELRPKRAALLGGRDPDEEERRLRSELAGRQADLEAGRAEALAAEKRRDQLAVSLAEAERELADLDGLVQARSETFQAGLQAAGLADEAAWLAAALPEDRRLELERRSKNLASDQAGLTARLADHQARLAEAAARDLSPLTAPELEAELERLAAEGRERLARRGVVEQKLADRRQAAETQGRLRLALEAQRRELARWNRLNELIGSRDGHKYRKFAQGLSFEILVAQANRQLAALSDRYLLKSDPERPLELSVIDNYQAGQIRSTKNLSGGEGFLVSLALALGLARLAGRRVRVDTLFLDEGFGTLDPDALDQALDTLAALRSEGKLIGVISHIRALTDRIPARIEVRPLGGALSQVSGPGVEPAGPA